MELVNTFTIWVTTACNMRCRYCYEGHQKKAHYMSESVADYVVNWIIQKMEESDSSQSVIRFHGGEPTLNMKTIRYMIEKLNVINREFQFYYHITSNGYFISKEDMKFLAENMTDISISLDGSKEINDAERIDISGNGTFDIVIRNAKKLKDIFPELWIRMTLNPYSCKYLTENINYFIEQGFNNISVALDFTSEIWTTELLDELKEQCTVIWESMVVKEARNRIVLPLNNNLACLNSCSGGVDKFEVDTLGYIYPCTYVVGEKEHCIGDVYNGLDIRKIKNVTELTNKKLVMCDGCEGYNSCITTRCKFVNKKILNDYLTPIPLLCEIHRREIDCFLKR